MTMNTRAEAFMRRAIKLGRQGMDAGDGGPFGSVIVKDGSIVGEGWNRVLATNDPTAHGEVVAIRDACSRAKSFSLSGCEIYTSGEPCPMCLAAVYWARIDRLYFGFSVDDAAGIGFDDRHIFDEMMKESELRTVPAVQLLRDEALAALEDYAVHPKRVRY